MIISELRVYDFRQFKSVDDAPGLKITFHKGLNALIGENDSGKTAVIDALKLVLLLILRRCVLRVQDRLYDLRYYTERSKELYRISFIQPNGEWH